MECAGDLCEKAEGIASRRHHRHCRRVACRCRRGIDTRLIRVRRPAARTEERRVEAALRNADEEALCEPSDAVPPRTSWASPHRLTAGPNRGASPSQCIAETVWALTLHSYVAIGKENYMSLQNNREGARPREQSQTICLEPIRRALGVMF
jgi:hypothetical protein